MLKMHTKDNPFKCDKMDVNEIKYKFNNKYKYI